MMITTSFVAQGLLRGAVCINRRDRHPRTTNNYHDDDSNDIVCGTRVVARGSLHQLLMTMKMEEGGKRRRRIRGKAKGREGQWKGDKGGVI
jgi:hypothetical protein